MQKAPEQKIAPTLMPLLLTSLLAMASASFFGGGDAMALSHDGLSLLALKRAMAAATPYAFDNWNENDSTPCHWHGVSCNTLSGYAEPRVVSLTMVGLNLSGTIPPELAALAELRRLSLHQNQISGSIPPCLFSNATQLRSVFLQSNLISGAIPPEIASAQFLQNLDLSENRLSGVIPAEIGQCRQLQRLSLSGNEITGVIPVGIGTNLTSLEELDLSDNRLTGGIPAELGNLTSLKSTLNLSFNFLAGSIPESLARLPYTVGVDLSHNNLSGRIPQEGSLVDQGPGAFIANPGLCGFPLTRPCPTAPSAPTIPSIPHDAENGAGGGMQPVGPYGAATPAAAESGRRRPAGGMGAAAIVGIAVGDAVGISAVGGLLLYFYWKVGGKDREGEEKEMEMGRKRWRCCGSGVGVGGGRKETEAAEDEDEEEEEGESSTEEGSSGNEGGGEGGRVGGGMAALDKGFSYGVEELLRAAAVVVGSKGVVYKVALGGEAFAVRRLGDGGGKRRRRRRWRRELEAEALGVARAAARHPNVVRLRAFYCSSDETLLIYDFINNGSLASSLHGHTKPLTWTQRLKVAAGAAAGLAFIHDCSPRKYVHGDIKASKILLDDRMNGVIADFGVARLASLAATWQGGASSSSAYRPPERGGSGAVGRPTQKWDIYAFGVVLLEMISGRSAAAQRVNGGEDLVTWARRAAAAAEAASPTALLDPCLAHCQISHVTDFLDVALCCTATSAEARPRMKTVAEMLHKISSAH